LIVDSGDVAFMKAEVVVVMMTMWPWRGQVLVVVTWPW